MTYVIVDIYGTISGFWNIKILLFHVFAIVRVLFPAELLRAGR